MMSIDERLTRAADEVATQLASVPTGDASRVARQAVRRRAIKIVTAMVVVTVVGAFALFTSQSDRDVHVTSGGPVRLQDISILGLPDNEWILGVGGASESMGEEQIGGSQVSPIPMRHLGYAHRQADGSFVTIELRGIAAGSPSDTTAPPDGAVGVPSEPVLVRNVEGRQTADGRTVTWRESATTVAVVSVHGGLNPPAASAVAEELEPISPNRWKAMIKSAHRDPAHVTTSSTP